MVKSLPIIPKDLSWQVGRGLQVYLEIDPLCGLGDNYVLSHDLVVSLHCLNLFVLKDVHRVSCNKIWVDYVVLGLSRRLIVEWDKYISYLNQGNITLSTKPDKLVWAFNIR